MEHSTCPQRQDMYILVSAIPFKFCLFSDIVQAELRLFPRSFYITTKDIFSNNWSDPIYFGKLFLASLKLAFKLLGDRFFGL